MEFRTYFVYFHTFSYKFKVQQTPSEFGLPVDGATFHDRMDNKGAAFSTPSMWLEITKVHTADSGIQND